MSQGSLGQVVQGGHRDVSSAESHRCLDHLGKYPDAEAVLVMFACLLRGGERGLVLTQAVVEDGGRELDAGHRQARALRGGVRTTAATSLVASPRQPASSSVKPAIRTFPVATVITSASSTRAAATANSPAKMWCAAT
jgi:hypothetical protein